MTQGSIYISLFAIPAASAVFSESQPTGSTAPVFIHPLTIAVVYPELLRQLAVDEDKAVLMSNPLPELATGSASSVPYISVTGSSTRKRLAS